MEQVDGVAPAGIVHEQRRLPQLAEVTVADELPDTLGLFEEAIVKDHRRLGAGGTGALEQCLGGEEILFDDIGLAVLRHERLLKKEPLGAALKQFHRRRLPLRLACQHEHGVRFRCEQLEDGIGDAAAKVMGACFGFAPKCARSS